MQKHYFILGPLHNYQLWLQSILMLSVWHITIINNPRCLAYVYIVLYQLIFIQIYYSFYKK